MSTISEISISSTGRPLSMQSEVDRPACVIPATHEAILRLLNLQKGASVLDVGCYHGALSMQLVKRGYCVASCDHVAHEGSATLPDFRLADASSVLPYPDCSFDGLIATDII